MSASIAAPRAARPRKFGKAARISKKASLTRIVLIVAATFASLFLAIRIASTNTCAEVVCRLDTSHATTGLAVVGPPPPVKPR